jgi:hypothetical protein
MREFKSGALHSGSPRGPVVSSPKQAIAIALSEQRASSSLGTIGRRSAPHPHRNLGGYLHPKKGR